MTTTEIDTFMTHLDAERQALIEADFEKLHAMPNWRAKCLDYLQKADTGEKSALSSFYDRLKQHEVLIGRVISGVALANKTLGNKPASDDFIYSPNGNLHSLKNRKKSL